MPQWQKNWQSLPGKVKLDTELPWWPWLTFGLDFKNAHLQSSTEGLGLVLSSFTLNRWGTQCHDGLVLAQHYTLDFWVDDLSFAQFCSHFLLASLQKSLWPKFESSQGISCKWNWLSRLLTEDATTYWMETSSNRDLLELHTCLYVHYCLGGQTFSVCHVRMTFCGAPGALRFDPWALCTKQDTQATSQSPWAMLTSTELSMSKGNPICAEHQHQALTLWNALTGRRLLFASAFFFAEAKSLISASATPVQSGMCSLGAAEIPAASCQEFINY